MRAGSHLVQTCGANNQGGASVVLGKLSYLIIAFSAKCSAKIHEGIQLCRFSYGKTAQTGTGS